MLDVNKIRNDFPILSQKAYNKPLVYLDNGATTQKPQFVLDKINKFYSSQNSNIHRGAHYLSEQATAEYEKARLTIKQFVNANHLHEIIFTKGTTDSINLVAFSYGEKFVNEGDEILVSEMEHHSNIVPWQLLCERKNATLKVIPINDAGELIMSEFEKLINKNTKLVAVTHVSNTLGTINPIKEIIRVAHKNNVPVLIDGAQGIQHTKVNVQELDCDFYAFSGHKIYAETGIGILYGKEKYLNSMPPYQGGGNMVDIVSFEKTTYNELPHKFEAGTTNFGGAISLSAALQYISNIGIDKISEYELDLLNYATEKLSEIEGLVIYGTANNKSSAISFLLDGIHHYDVGVMLDKTGVAVRTGTHCNQPLMKRLGITGTVRASFSFYNTKEEVDILCNSINRVKQIFS